MDFEILGASSHHNVRGGVGPINKKLGAIPIDRDREKRGGDIETPSSPASGVEKRSIPLTPCRRELSPIPSAVTARSRR